MKLRIKEWMELRNVSQAQIAAALGVSRATVSAWVEGRPGKDGGKRLMVFPDADGFEALCLFMECTPSDMLELQRRKTPTGLVWRDFRDAKRGPGRPPMAAARAGHADQVEVDDDEHQAEPMQEEDDVEEIMLFAEPAPASAPAPQPPAREAPRSSDELLGLYDNAPLASLRDWLGVQLSQTNGQMRKGPTPELRAMQTAFTRALNKLDHYAQKD